MQNSFTEKKGLALAEKMTVREQIAQLKHASKGVKRLGILPYNWWNECLHGVARAGTATVFPQAICMAATFSEELIYKTARIISEEARKIQQQSEKWRLRNLQGTYDVVTQHQYFQRSPLGSRS